MSLVSCVLMALKSCVIVIYHIGDTVDGSEIQLTSSYGK